MTSRLRTGIPSPSGHLLPVADAGLPRRVELEMGYSLDEFDRVLPLAMRDWRVDGGDGQWQVRTTDGADVARIAVQPQAPRRMGMLELPVLMVSLDLSAADERRAGEFMHRFERGFHRGGG